MSGTYKVIASSVLVEIEKIVRADPLLSEKEFMSGGMLVSKLGFRISKRGFSWHTNLKIDGRDYSLYFRTG